MAYQIKPFCLGCHYCALECPTHAIDYVGTQYQIDPEKCIECGKCVAVCNISAIDTGKPEQVVPHEPLELEADCVVIGAGAGGSVAAVKLAELTENRAASAMPNTGIRGFFCLPATSRSQTHQLVGVAVAVLLGQINHHAQGVAPTG